MNLKYHIEYLSEATIPLAPVTAEPRSNTDVR